ncbi:EF-hand [Metschnikowia bicuspidata]|uniref:Calcium-binding protein NCS-1 n=1 Tax=Metschnikowia bicuspidata TaxID=27322 RepID=A0A4P9ZGS6_9ASCO|nr:EF-hand [Metschnikowia bicuspidata]
MGKTVSKLSKDEIKQLRDRTLFDKRELQQWYKGFLRDCPSGHLSEEEFAKVFKQFFPFGDPSDYCQYIFRVFDPDNSKYVDFKEFIVALSLTARGDILQKLDFTFKLYDLDGDGKVQYSDLLAVILSIFKMVGPLVEMPKDEATPEMRAMKLFAAADKDPETDFLDFSDFKRIVKSDPSLTNSLNSYEGLV